MKSLAFQEMDSRSNDIEPPADGTCEWLLQHEAYKHWAARERGLLWVKGKPGSGKSTLLRHALDKIMEKARVGDGALVFSFFFHNRGAELQKTQLGLFRSLLHQVLSQGPDALQEVAVTFQKRCGSVGELGEKWKWHLRELQGFFELALLKVLESHPVLLLIDAVDECGEEAAVDLAARFKTLLQKLPAAGPERLHILLTGRHYPIQDMDGGAWKICLEDENEEDISTYVNEQLLELCAPLAPRIPAIITARASGVFLWARLVVKRVRDLRRRGVSFRKIEQEIYSVPADLDELFCNLIQGINANERPASLLLVQWVCFSMQRLTLDELRCALIADPDCPYRSSGGGQSAGEYVCDCQGVCSCDMMARRVTSLSCGLVETVSSRRGPVVQFIHQTVKDFFVDKGLALLGGGSQPPEPPETEASRAHSRLSRTCVQYLATREISDSLSTASGRDYLESSYPLLRYAVDEWYQHTRFAGAESHSKILLDCFAWPSEHILHQWVRILHLTSRDPHNDLSQMTTMLHVAALFRLTGLLRAIGQEGGEVGIDFNAKDHRGRTPLACAAGRGHEIEVALLLGTGKVHVDSADSGGRTPLSWAAGGQHQAVVELLLNHGADAAIADIDGLTPFHWSVWRCEEKAVELFLRIGRVPPIDMPMTCWFSQSTCQQGSLACEPDDDPRYSTAYNGVRYGLTALHYAALTGSVGITQLLLVHGADANVVSQFGETPLHLALRQHIHGPAWGLGGGDRWNDHAFRAKNHLVLPDSHPGIPEEFRDRMDLAVKRRLAVLDALLSQRTIDIAARDNLGYRTHRARRRSLNGQHRGPDTVAPGLSCRRCRLSYRTHRARRESSRHRQGGTQYPASCSAVRIRGYHPGSA